MEFKYTLKQNSDDLIFGRIPSELGPSSNRIYAGAIIQDKYGFMWFGSMDGLNKFDGYRFIVYKANQNDIYSIPNNFVTTICEDIEGILWFGTANGDLAKYDRENDRFINMSDRNVIPSKFILSIVEDINGDLLIGIDGLGLRVFDKKENRLRFFDNPDSTFNGKSIGSILPLNNNLLMLGSSFGIVIYDKINKSITRYNHGSLDKNSLNYNRISYIFRDSRKRIWLATENGLNIFNFDKKDFEVFKTETSEQNSISSDWIYHISEDKNGNIWVATRKGGLIKYNEDGAIKHYKYDINNPNSISTNDVTSVYVDKSNVLWTTAWGGEICKVDLERKKFNTLSKIFLKEENNYNISTTAVYTDSGNNIWICTRFNDGIYNFKVDETGELKLKNYYFISKLIKESQITSIVEDDKSNLWMTDFLGGQLIRFNKNNGVSKIYTYKSLYKPTQRTMSLCIKDNIVFIPLVLGEFLNFDIVNEKFVELSTNFPVLAKLPRDSYFYILTGSKNNLWIATRENGLFEYDFGKDSLRNYRSEKNNTNSISGDEVISMFEDSIGNLWVGTGTGGIDRLDKSGIGITRFGERIGINSRINGIVEDSKGILWLSSNDGLFKFDPNKEQARSYKTNDGVLNYNFNNNICTKDKYGNLYIGGSTGGLTYFHPDEIKDNPYMPNVFITDFQIFNNSIKPSFDNPFLKKSITHTEAIILSHKESVFSFEFAALIYNNPSKNQYAYMMEGFDKDWVYCETKRNVTYTNLDPGDYTFRVKGSNNDGIWNEEGTSIKITITPPWWQTWWFKSCGAALVLLTSGFGYKKRVYKLKKEKLAQEEYSRKLLSSQEEERKRIANELHDSIAHDILILKNDAVNAMNKVKDEETRIILNKISDQSSETLNDVRNISYNLHPHQIEALGLTKAIKSIIDKSSGSSKVNFIHDIENIDKIFTEENEVHIYRIVQEAISNIIKYSDSPEAIIKISCNKKSVSILISDIGKGFDVESVEKGSLGLSGISERVKILGGEMNIESKRGEGTVMKILIPFINT